MLIELIVGVMLGISGVEDLKKKKLHLWYPLSGAVLGVAVQLWQRAFVFSECLLGILLGGVIIGIAGLSRGQIGMGDALILTACGICLGWKRQLILLGTATVLFLLIGGGAMLFKRRSGRTPIPFVPFLWAAFMIQQL